MLPVLANAEPLDAAEAGRELATEIGAWLRLTETDGVGPEIRRRLLSAFGLPQQVFEASAGQLGKLVPERIALALRRSPSDELQRRIDATHRWAVEPGNHFLTLADTRYPKRLFEIADPPPVLYVKGRVDLLDRPSIAIVGSRNATAQGRVDAERFADALSHAGWTIVSGLALGIDAAAHEGALKAAGEGAGSTIAIIGTGADIVYPSRNRALAHRIAEHGAIASEFPLGMPAIDHNFPRRNRIISGLARGVLVIEAAARSGSLITARLAGEQGREVFAIPGSIHSPLSKGCHRLIKEGAKLVESAEDVLVELGASAMSVTSTLPAREAASGDRASIDESSGKADSAILDAIGFDPVLPDEIAARTGSSAAEIATQLLELELAGSISRLPGGRVQRLVS